MIYDCLRETHKTGLLRAFVRACQTLLRAAEKKKKKNLSPFIDHPEYWGGNKKTKKKQHACVFIFFSFSFRKKYAANSNLHRVGE